MTSDVIVIAAGSTVKDYFPQALNLTKYATVIAVNDAAIHAQADYAVTMDRLWLEYRYDALQEKLNTNRLAEVYARRGTTQNLPDWEESGFVWFDAVNRTAEFDTSKNFRQLNGSNSGVVALNLAYKLKPERVFMLGFDMKLRAGKAYWYPEYPWAKGAGTKKPGKYKGWAKEMKTVKREFVDANIMLYNVTHDSAIDPEMIKQITFEQMLEMTR